MDEYSIVKKRLVLTTVYDNQRSVQIDLYKSATKTMADILYIGSLVVENIEPRPEGEPSVEMVISSNSEGEITADAIDLDNTANAEHQILTVSLKSLDEDNQEYEIPDFELEQVKPPPPGLYDRANTAKNDKKPANFPVRWALIAGLVIIIACLALWFFLLRVKLSPEQQKTRTPTESTVPVTPLPSQTAQPVVPAQAPAAPVTPPPPASPPPVIQAPPAVSRPAAPSRPVANRTRPAAPVSRYKVPDSIPPNGAPYKIRWGDTLWDIAEAFYRDPWQYRRIVRFNNIRNPNLIVSGTTIRIPPGN
jgi:nucleoid-associated protein YgaU